MVIQVFRLILLLYVIPTCMGMALATYVDKYKRNILFMWICGMVEMWAVFQFVTVPFIIKERKFEEVVIVYGVCIIALALAGLIVWSVSYKKTFSLRVAKVEGERKETITKVFWCVFGVLLLLQLGMAALGVFADGDDAFYVATSTITAESNTMYIKLPYTGGATGVDMRHGVAPFPVWISFLSRVSGVQSVIIAHVVLPIVMIPMTYAIYGLIGRHLCAKRDRFFPLYMIFVSLFILWGNYSISTAETFLITRTRQGKTALGNVVIPLLFLIAFLIGEKIQEKKRINLAYWCVVTMGVAAACLCSALGAFLAALLLGVFGLCQAVCNKQWKIILPISLSCVPAIVYVGIYALLK